MNIFITLLTLCILMGIDSNKASAQSAKTLSRSKTTDKQFFIKEDTIQHLSPDNMYCIVPNMETVEKMPELKKEYGKNGPIDNMPNKIRSKKAFPLPKIKAEKKKDSSSFQK